MKPRALLLGCAIGAMPRSSPAAAAAKTKQVTMGVAWQVSRRSIFEKNQGDANEFFPAKVTIPTGDKVRFTVAGFHDVDFPTKGGSSRSRCSLPTGREGRRRAATRAGAAVLVQRPADQVGFNPTLARASGLRQDVAATRAPSAILSGPAGRRRSPKPMTVKFTEDRLVPPTTATSTPA